MPLTDRRPDPLTAAASGLLVAFLAALAPQAAPVAAAPPPPAVAPPAPAAAAVVARVLNDVAGPSPKAPTVVLTFDDGPDPHWTPQVLAALRRHGAVGTFCMIASKAEAQPDLVRDVAAAGMQICDHSRSHDEHLPDRSDIVVDREVVGAGQDLARLADTPVRYFRAPGGNWSARVIDTAAAAGMQPLGWSVDPRDWARPGVPAIVSTVQRTVHPGAIVLLHDGGGRREQTLAALEQLLPWLKAKGYTFGFPMP